METHELMTVNNMLVETLNPENMVAKLYNKNLTPSQKQRLLKEMRLSTSHFTKKNVKKY
jgi:hypothetical protein